MKKRAVSLSMNTIVIAALALLILVILILVFRSQIGKTTQSYLDIGQQAEKEAKGTDNCETMFGNRKCMSACVAQEAKDASGKVIKVIPYVEVSGDWKDCAAKNMVCCEPVS